MNSLMPIVLLGALFVSQNEAPARFKITTRKADDTVAIASEQGKTVFIVKSPTGISQAVIERNDDPGPAVIVLRLHLKGLENFKAACGKTTLEGAVSMQDGKPMIRLWKDGKEDAPLDEKSPYWVPIAIGNGYFELPLPRALLEANAKSLTISWIDFYR